MNMNINTNTHRISAFNPTFKHTDLLPPTSNPLPTPKSHLSASNLPPTPPGKITLINKPISHSPESILAILQAAEKSNITQAFILSPDQTSILTEENAKTIAMAMFSKLEADKTILTIYLGNEPDCDMLLKAFFKILSQKSIFALCTRPLRVQNYSLPIYECHLFCYIPKVKFCNTVKYT